MPRGPYHAGHGPVGRDGTDQSEVVEVVEVDLSDIAFDGPVTQRGIGIIAPFDLALERELWRWTPLDVSLHLARTPFEPVPVSLRMAELVSSRAHVQAATRDVLGVDPEVVAYLCTSGSFIHGVAGERELRRSMVEAGAPESLTTSGALAEAVRSLGLERISVITPYDEELTQRLVGYLDELGVQVPQCHHLGPGRRDLAGQLPHGGRADPGRGHPAVPGGVRLVHEPAHL